MSLIHDTTEDAPVPPTITPAGVALKGITGYATRDGVLYLFRVPDQLRDFIQGGDWSRVAWIDKVVLVDEPSTSTTEDASVPLPATPDDFRRMLGRFMNAAIDSGYGDPDEPVFQKAYELRGELYACLVNAYAAALARADTAEAIIAATSKVIADRGVWERDCTAPLPDRVDALIVEQRSAEWWRCKAEMAEEASKPEG